LVIVGIAGKVKVILILLEGYFVKSFSVCVAMKSINTNIWGLRSKYTSKFIKSKKKLILRDLFSFLSFL
jgi:hypothetical protein